MKQTIIQEQKLLLIIFLFCTAIAVISSIYYCFMDLLQPPALAELGATQLFAALGLILILLLGLEIAFIRWLPHRAWRQQKITAVGFLLFWLFGMAQLLLTAGLFNGSATDLIAQQLQQILLFPYLLLLVPFLPQKPGRFLLPALLLTAGFLAQNVLHLVAAYHFSQMEWLTRLLNSLCLLFLFYLFYQNRKEDPRLFRFVGIGTLLLACCFLLEFLTTPEHNLFLTIGLTLLFIGLFCHTLCWADTAVREETKEKILRQHALIDYQTRMRSRLAFEDFYYHLDKQYQGSVAIGLMVIDLNNLKEINDRYGNAAGDQMLKDTARCIEEVFNKEAHCFRTGGDEFAVLTVNSSYNMEEGMRRLDECITAHNLRQIHPLSIARGICMDQSDVSDQDKLRKIYKAADDRMYQDKIQKHEQLKVQMIQERYLRKQMLQEQMIREKHFQEQMTKVAKAKQAADSQKKQNDDGRSKTEDYRSFWGDAAKSSSPAVKNPTTKEETTVPDEVGNQIAAAPAVPETASALPNESSEPTASTFSSPDETTAENPKTTTTQTKS